MYINYMIICGIDEAGRGPIAGPVTAASVILPIDFPVSELNDSKKMSPGKREKLELLIKAGAIAYGIGWVSHRTIDKINIHNAALLAMKKSFHAMLRRYNKDIEPGLILHVQNLHILTDGRFTPDISGAGINEAVIKGDASVPQIMAASIIAKTARDRWMRSAAEKYPLWSFERHKGYPTQLHRDLCRTHGLSPIHRKSFNFL